MNAFIVFRRAGALALAGIALLALPALAQGDDAAIQSRVESRLRKAGLDREPDVRASVQQGTVVLDGAVTTVAAKAAAEKAAGKESKAVVNRLRVVPEAERSDADIRKEASKLVLGYVHYGVFDSVALGVDNGVLTLTGSVYQPYHKNDLEARLAKVAGVREIRNEIQVQSNSFFDERLRRQIAFQVYGTDKFTNLSHANPPVRILVDHGRVTLTGYVNSEVERVMLGHIARGTLAFGVDNQVKLDREAKPEDQKPAGAEI
jgi:osmotically-inducible protein OsmY